MANGRIELKVSDDDEDVGYVSLPDHPPGTKPGMVRRSVRLRTLMPAYGDPSATPG